MNACTEGLMIGPPAESEYAVEPVGVETMRPSPRRLVTNWPSIERCISIILESVPLLTTTSFRTVAWATCSPWRSMRARSIKRSSR